MVAIRLFSSGSLSVGPRGMWPGSIGERRLFASRFQAPMGCEYCIHWNQGGRNPSRYLLPFTTVRVLDQWIDPFGEGLGSALRLGATGASGFCPEKPLWG